MSHLLLLTASTQSSAEVLPALSILPHNVKILPADIGSLDNAPPCDAILIDSRSDAPQARSLTRQVHQAQPDCPIIVIVNEGGFAMADADWGLDDIIAESAPPAEIEARLRITAAKPIAGTQPDAKISTHGSLIEDGGLIIDEQTYSARINDRDLNLTFTEFELLRLLAQHPGRTFTREEILAHVWGADYFAGTRIVDARIRRIGSKMGAYYRQLIRKVDDTGFTFAPTNQTPQLRTALCRD